MGLGCIICTENFGSTDKEEKNPICIKKCGHVFHKACLDTWLAKSSSCPVCRHHTENSDAYVTKLHFQNLGLDTSAMFELIDETDQLRAELKRKDRIIALKEETIAKKDEIIAKKDKKIFDMRKSFANLSTAFSNVKDDFKEENAVTKIPSPTTTTTTVVSAKEKIASRKVKLVSTRSIQGRPSVAGASSSTSREASPFRVDDNFTYRAPKGPSAVAPLHCQHPAVSSRYSMHPAHALIDSPTRARLSHIRSLVKTNSHPSSSSKQ